MSTAIVDESPTKTLNGAILGTGQFVDDIKVPGMLHAGIIRSTYAHARIRKVDFSRASAHPSFVNSLDISDVVNLSNPLPNAQAFSGKTSALKPTIYCLAQKKVHYVGEPIGAFVTNNKYAIEDIAELMSVEYEPLETAVSAEDSLRMNKDLLYDEFPNNLIDQLTLSSGDVEKALQNAEFVVSERIKSHRYVASPIETRGCVADYDGSKLTIWLPHQMPHVERKLLSDVLRMPENRIRIISPSVGGAFGARIPTYPDEIIVSLLAIKSGKPVKYSQTRTEDLMTSTHSRELTHDVRVAFDQNGVIESLEDKITADNGAYFPTAYHQGFGSMVATCKMITGPYKIKNMRVDLFVVATNKSPYGAYRGFGKVDAALVYERIVELVGKKLGLDGVEVRRRNLVTANEFPYVSAAGQIYDSGDYSETLRRVVEESGYPNAHGKGKLGQGLETITGTGVSLGLEASAAFLMGGYETAVVDLNQDGKIVVRTGLSSIGQGLEVSLAEIVRQEMGIRDKDIVVEEGDTDTCPNGLGSFSSRSSVGFYAVRSAVRETKAKIMEIVAKSADTNLESLEMIEGSIVSKRNNERLMNLKDFAARFHSGVKSVCRYTPMLNSIPSGQSAESPYSTVANGACVAMIEIDRETGRVTPASLFVVHDCGVILNETIVDGQIHGGTAQAVSGAVYEDMRYGEDGELLSSTFMDYLLATSTDLCDVSSYHYTTKGGSIPGGYKGCGEMGTIVALPALVNAAQNCVSAIGGRRVDLPLSPENVWRAIKEKSHLD